MIWASLFLALLLAAIHLFSRFLRVLDGIPRSRLLSAAGGMAVSYAILMLLPAIARHQRTLEETAAAGALSFLNHHAYVVLLMSLVLYYGLERLAKRSRITNQRLGVCDRASRWVFAISIGNFALLNLLVGYLLVEHAEREPARLTLFLFATAMLFKFLVNDHALYHDYKELYDRVGRWIVIAAVLTGWTVNYFTEVPGIAPALLQSFLAGGVLLNVLREELPPERESRYWAFLLGAGAYGALLVSL